MSSPNPTAKLVLFGNILVDFTYNIEKFPAILSKHGLKADALGERDMAQLMAIKKDGEEKCEFVSSQTGGSALNTAKILSLLDIKEHTFCGAIGDDVTGTLVKDKLRKIELKTHLQEITGQPTGMCVCLIKEANRSCYANIGASSYYENTFDKDRVISPILALRLETQKQYVYVEGFFITGNRYPVCKYLIDEVCERSDSARIFTANLSAAYIIKNHPDEIKYIAEHATILFGNYQEFTELAELFNIPTAEEVIAHLVDPSKKNGDAEKIVVCTQGAGNVLYSSRAHKFQNRSYAVRPVPKESIVDTTGCGDAFVAGFFAELLNNATVTKCVAKGVEVALKKLTSVGGTFAKE